MPDTFSWPPEGLRRLAGGAAEAPLPGPVPQGRRSAGWVPERAGDAAPAVDRAAELRAAVAGRVPPSWRAARWAVPRSAGALVLVLALTVSVAAVVWSLLAAPGPATPAVVPVRTEVTPAGPPVTQEPAPSAAAPTSAGVVVVHVVGQVASPGVVELPVGSRVADAVDAAGGVTRDADLARVNLARPLVDGEQVVVPRPGEEVPVPPAAGSPGSDEPGEPAPDVVDLNSASAADLDALPGIGPVLSERIVAWREEHGRFSSVDELLEVSGIGQSLLERLRPLVRV
ncbi:MAG: helix-hairpin-helix domain-containing protein [Actinomycetes bacterium]